MSVYVCGASAFVVCALLSSQKMLMDFLEAVFSLPADLYSSQHHLVAELRGQVERHLEVMITSLLSV